MPEYHGLQVSSLVTDGGTLRLELVTAPSTPPAPGQVVVRIEAAPINPSDLIILLGGADPADANFGGTRDRPTVSVELSPAAQQDMSRRIGRRLAVGLEGAGVVVATGPDTTGLLGAKVALMSPKAGMFGQFITVAASDCAVLPDGVSTVQGAAMFINPMTALAIVETVRLDGHKAFIHTAAASSLGQMLVKIALRDSVPLVNIVRRPEQANLLRGLGASYVCDTSQPSFDDDLHTALLETGATVAFDAIAGGTMTSDLLTAMERAAMSHGTAHVASLFGSSTHKQVFIYGHLDASPTVLSHHGYGLSWAVSGWSMPPILARVGAQRAAVLRQRVLDELTTTFATQFTRHISLREMLDREAMLGYWRQATGEKYLVTPQV